MKLRSKLLVIIAVSLFGSVIELLLTPTFFWDFDQGLVYLYMFVHWFIFYQWLAWSKRGVQGSWGDGYENIIRAIPIGFGFGLLQDYLIGELLIFLPFWFWWLLNFIILLFGIAANAVFEFFRIRITRRILRWKAARG